MSASLTERRTRLLRAGWGRRLDLQTWLHEHPPRRGRGTFLYGTRPCVHNGFLRSWLANGLQVGAGFPARGRRRHPAPPLSAGRRLHASLRRDVNLVKGWPDVPDDVSAAGEPLHSVRSRRCLAAPSHAPAGAGVAAHPRDRGGVLRPGPPRRAPHSHAHWCAAVALGATLHRDSLYGFLHGRLATLHRRQHVLACEAV